MSRMARINSAIVILSKIDELKKKPFGALTPDDKRALKDLRCTLGRLPSSIYRMAVASYDPAHPVQAEALASEFKITLLPPATMSGLRP